ncbi:hypothetical protein NP493_17g06005 [Ridgeia piscesae]|uniref:Uncharacterized protein n=1 Tax=Ridgeia piscesae TaxID=27915 RepID=A0AAD9PE94_RIDPI|nr:hypothetical protein NP493_17g06005 [Ridgeia piscesae]
MARSNVEYRLSNYAMDVMVMQLTTSMSHTCVNYQWPSAAGTKTTENSP